MKNYFVYLLLLLIGTFANAEGSTRLVDLSNQESKVEFLAIGKPSLLKINGTGGKLKGQLEVKGQQVSGQFVLPLDLISTGISLRDDHMKNKYLEVSKYPEATLQIAELKLDKDFFAVSGSQKNIPFKGKLRVHGAEKDIEGTVNIDSDEKSVSVFAQTKTVISAHQIDIPSYMGIKVADEVEITAQVKIKK